MILTPRNPIQLPGNAPKKTDRTAILFCTIIMQCENNESENAVERLSRIFRRKDRSGKLQNSIVDGGERR